MQAIVWYFSQVFTRIGLSVSAIFNYKLTPELSTEACYTHNKFKVKNCLALYSQWADNKIAIYPWYQFLIPQCKNWVSLYIMQITITQYQLLTKIRASTKYVQQRANNYYRVYFNQSIMLALFFCRNVIGSGERRGLLRKPMPPGIFQAVQRKLYLRSVITVFHATLFPALLLWDDQVLNGHLKNKLNIYMYYFGSIYNYSELELYKLDLYFLRMQTL